MRLVIFDIDGTLSNTNKVDNECFNLAFSDVLNLKIDGSVWEGCKHITDLGLAHHIYKKKYSRLPRIYEVNRIKNALVAYFESRYIADPELFAEVPGAVACFHELKDTEGIAVAIATGCWKESAIFKLEALNIDYSKTPIGHSDQHLSRAEITLDAIEQAKIKFGCRAFDRITYIGDGLWDLETTRALNLNFIGIDCNRTGVLKSNGTENVVTHFNDPLIRTLLLD